MDNSCYPLAILAICLRNSIVLKDNERSLVFSGAVRYIHKSLVPTPYYCRGMMILLPAPMLLVEPTGATVLVGCFLASGRGRNAAPVAPSLPISISQSRILSPHRKSLHFSKGEKEAPTNLCSRVYDRMGS